MAMDAGHEAMLRLLRSRYNVVNERVLDAMAIVRRDRFVPSVAGSDPFGDHPVGIGFEQTISQPFIVACMTDLLDVNPGDRVLEIGTGSGYQSAVLCALGAEVDSVERIPELAAWAKATLIANGFGRVRVHVGDGAEGWPAGAPYDAVIVTCAAREIPQALLDQLADGGRLVAPVGEEIQRLVCIRKRDGRVHREDGISVRFVPFVSSRL